MGVGLFLSLSWSIHFSIPYRSACDRSGGVSIFDSVTVRLTRAISVALAMSVFGHLMMWSSVLYCHVLQFGHLPLIELSLFCIRLSVGIQLCCSFVLRAGLCCGSLLFALQIAVHARESKVLLFQSGCFSRILFWSGPLEAWKWMYLV